MLGKFRKLPVVVFVVVLKNERNPSATGIVVASDNRINGVSNTVFPGYFGSTLTGEDPTI